MAISLVRPSPGAITSGFGPRSGGFHYGTDFGWGNGWNIFAAAAGTVIHSGPGGKYGARYGNLTVIDHAGFQTRYGHQSQMYVRPGLQVPAGAHIGVKGGSGAKGLNDYPPHLHFELLVGGVHRDAKNLFTAPASGDIIRIPDSIYIPTQEGAIAMPELYGFKMPSGPVPKKYLDVNKGLVPGLATYMHLGGSPGTLFNAKITQSESTAKQWASQLSSAGVVVEASYGWADQMWDQALAPLRIDFTGLNVQASGTPGLTDAEVAKIAADVASGIRPTLEAIKPPSAESIFQRFKAFWSTGI